MTTTTIDKPDSDGSVTSIGSAPSLKDRLTGAANGTDGDKPAKPEPKTEKKPTEPAAKKPATKKPAAKKKPAATNKGGTVELDESVYQGQVMVLDLPDDDAKAWEIWKAEGEKLTTIANGHQFWLGDWYKLGEDRFGDNDAAGVFGPDWDFDETTINQYVRVSVAFPEKDRRRELSWTHHKSAAALPTIKLRRKALAWAVKNGASDADLRGYVRSLKGDDDGEKEAAAKSFEHYRISWDLPVDQESMGAAILAAGLEGVKAKAKELGVDLRTLEITPA